jgi:hypothetical protein
MDFCFRHVLPTEYLLPNFALKMMSQYYPTVVQAIAPTGPPTKKPVTFEINKLSNHEPDVTYSKII